MFWNEHLYDIRDTGLAVTDHRRKFVGSFRIKTIEDLLSRVFLRRKTYLTKGPVEHRAAKFHEFLTALATHILANTGTCLAGDNPVLPDRRRRAVH